MLLAAPALAQNAFPGAVGFGSQTYGGLPTGTEATSVIKVTNLNADGAGSLKAALDATGRRVIVFEVGGVIDLGGPDGVGSLQVENPNVTIAGQTAPGMGITLIGGGLRINTHDVVVRHMKVRPGDAGQPKKSGWEPDGISTANNGNPHNVVIDHCSVSWAIDENVTIGGSSNAENGVSRNVTVSNCIISEGLSNATHSKGEHSKGTLLMDGAYDVAHVNNLLAHNVDRNPFYSAARGVLANNLIYNFGSGRVIYSRNGGHPSSVYVQDSQITAVGNVAQGGPNSDEDSNVFLQSSDTASGEPAGEKATSIYLEDNVLKNPDGTAMSTAQGSYAIVSEKLAWPEGLEALPSWKTQPYVLANAGATPWNRDPIDQRIVRNVLDGNGTFIDSQNDVGGYPTYPKVTRALTVPSDQSKLAEWLAGFEEPVAEPNYPTPPDPNSTPGWDATIRSGHDAGVHGMNGDDQTANNYGNDTTMLVRQATPDNTGYRRMSKAYVRFDLPGDIQTLEDASLVLHWDRDDIANKVIQVFGLLEKSDYGTGKLGEAWDESEINWDNAPGNPADPNAATLTAEQVVLLGEMRSPASPGEMAFSEADLLEFLREQDTNGKVTFILIAKEDSAALGRFRTSETDDGPKLLLNYEAVPEPTTAAATAMLVGLGLLKRTNNPTPGE